MAASLPAHASRLAARSPSVWLTSHRHIHTGQGAAFARAQAPASRRAMATTTTASPPAFDKVQNFRDVASSSPDTLRPGLFFRTARLDTASAADWQALRDTHGIRSTIDLRSEDEQKAAPPSADGIQAHRININGSSYSRALISHLSVTNQARLLFNAATGRRDAAIRILGTHAMTPRGLVGLATDTLDASGAEIKQVFRVLGTEENYPVAVSCHQGKDRTGLVTALVLLLCRVDAAAVQRDYEASTGADGMTKAETEARIHELANMGLPGQFAGTDSDFVRVIVQHCESRYGGVEGYLGHIGVDEDTRRAVRKVLLKAS